LTEAAMTIDDLLSFKDEEFGEDLKIYVRIRNSGGSVEISYASVDVDGEIYDLGHDDAINGKIEIVRGDTAMARDQWGPCEGAWQVKWSTATKGWGPLLYDVALEYATIHGNGIIADRDEISDQAIAVWDYYLNNRKQDVDSHQLDDPYNTRTPEDEDNCDQYLAQFGGMPDWQGPENSLSKRYTKDPTTIEVLNSLKRLKDETQT